MTFDLPFSRYIRIGWLISCLVHSGLAIAAILFMHRIELAPELEPFKWNVALENPRPSAAALSDTTRISPELAPSGASSQPTEAPTDIPHHPKSPSPAPPAPSHKQGQEKVHEQGAHPGTPLTSQQPPTSQLPEYLPQRHEPPTSEVASTPLHEPQLDSHPDQTTGYNDSPVNPPAITESVIHNAALTPSMASKPVRADYGWLSELMAHWIEDLDKHYPTTLRTEGIQGRVTLVAVLHESGVLSDVRVVTSSGNTMLDEVAVEDVRNGPRVKLSRPLERPQIPVKFSMVYDLRNAR